MFRLEIHRHYKRYLKVSQQVYSAFTSADTAKALVGRVMFL